jgi:tetratricopeptide (TPR) repeat protein
MVTVGTTLGRYVVTAPIGAGGMGEVFRASDTLLAREVAIKVLPDSFAHDPAWLARFQREAKALASLAHPNILAIYDYGCHDGMSFAVTELLRGETLRARLRHESRLPWRRAIEIAAAVAEGLTAAHTRGVTHRDLKPENLFLTADGGVKILDFGLAAVQQRADPGSGTLTFESALTAPGSILGTVGYMAPEQLCGLPTDGRADLFALGCIIYEMVTGVPAFRRGTVAETNAAVLRDEPGRLDSFGFQAPEPLSDLIRHCLEKDPGRRIGQARAVATALLGLRSVTARVCGPDLVGPSDPDRTAAVDSLAVLPFLDTTGPWAEFESPGDEIAEGVLARLYALPRVRVTARVASFRFRGGDVDPQAVGRALGTHAVLTGRVRVHSAEVVVRAELVGTSDGALLWNGEHRRSQGDPSAIVLDLANAIAKDLRAHLDAGPGGGPRRRPPPDPEAQREFRQGRYYLERRTEDDFHKGGERLRRAIALDPDFSQAYAGLAELHALLGGWGASPPRATFPTAKQLALKAIELEPDLVDARVVLGFVAMVYEWDWPGAEDTLRQAVELAPNHATAHARLSYLLMLRSRFDEALTVIRHAQRLDPLSPLIRANVGYVLYFMRRFDDALIEYQAALAIDPRFPSGYYYLGLVYEEIGDLDRAIVAFEHAVDYSRGVPGDIISLSHALVRKGMKSEAEETFRGLLDLASRRYVPSCLIGTGHLFLGRPQEGFDWLQRAVRERDYYLIYLPVDPRLAEFRSDSRFVEVLGRIEGDPAAAASPSRTYREQVS